jgi:hypothetical protein
MTSVSALMKFSTSDWDLAVNTNRLHSKIKKYAITCTPIGQTAQTKGLLQKHDFDPGTKLAVIGDIHGDDLRLERTLKALEQRGFLDSNFKCLPGTHILFLGDYVDRGSDSLKVLELLITLKMQNPTRIDLIRGDHEVLATSQKSPKDRKYQTYLESDANKKILSSFFSQLPVTVYVGQKDSSPTIEYAQFCHALFHLYTDPTPLLASNTENATCWITDSTAFSKRIKLLALDSSENTFKHAHTILSEVAKKITIRFDDIFWLDADTTSRFESPIGRIALGPEPIKAYLKVISTKTRKAKEIVRGHQAGIWQLKDPKTSKVLLTTLDPSTNKQEQTFMEITVAHKVCDWKKTLITISLSDDETTALSKLTALNARIMPTLNPVSS